MCYGNVDSKYMMRDIEARVRPLAQQAAAAPAQRSGWLGGLIPAIRARIVALIARPGKIAEPRP